MKKNMKIFRVIVLLFVVVALISFTYAWFTYSNFVGVDTSVDVRSWNIEMKDGENVVTNTILVSSTEIYPGMDPVTETIDINNLGDTDAILGIKVDYAKILDVDEYIVSDTVSSEQIIDSLSNNYPFKINVSLSKNYLHEKTGSSVFDVSITWPLDTGNDIEDSKWGMDAYNFIEAENNKLIADPTYVMKNPIEIKFSVFATQDVHEDDASDGNYVFGDTVLFDVVNNKSCTSISSTCLKTNVIDIDNKRNDATVSLLPDVKNSYQVGTYVNYSAALNNTISTWNVTARALKLEDILPIISKDVNNSVIKKDTMSDIVIGNVNYNDRVTTKINETITYGGYYTFVNAKFAYLSSVNCVWLENEYNATEAFAMENVDVSYSKIYNNDKNNLCRTVPVIEATKTALSTN